MQSLYTSGRNTDTILRPEHVQCKEDNHKILGNTVMAPIGYRIKNIYAGQFFGWTHEGKTIGPFHSIMLGAGRNVGIFHKVRK